MKFEEAQFRMSEIAKIINSSQKVQSVLVLSQLGMWVSANLADMAALYENLVMMHPDTKLGMKYEQSIKEREYVVDRSNVEAKRLAFIDTYEEELNVGVLEAKIKVISNYQSALRENLNALGRRQRALENEQLSINKQT